MSYQTMYSLDKLRTTQWLSEEKIKKYQWSRLEKLLRHSYKNVSYYNNIFDKIGLNVSEDIS